jgi:hypothetical protein
LSRKPRSSHRFIRTILPHRLRAAR